MSYHYQIYVNAPSYGIKGGFLWRVKTTWQDHPTAVLAADEEQPRNVGNFKLNSTLRIGCTHGKNKTLLNKLHIYFAIFRLTTTKMLMWFCDHDTYQIQKEIDKMKTQYFFAYTLKGRSVEISENQFFIDEQ